MKFLPALELDVTVEDIMVGRQADPWSCPVARSARRRFLPESCSLDSDYSVAISMSSVCIRDGNGEETSYWLDAVGRQFVDDYDSGSVVSPCKIRLTLKASMKSVELPRQPGELPGSDQAE